MTVCSHTGISVPECSCRACLQAQIERHMPSLLDATPADAPTVEVLGIALIVVASAGVLGAAVASPPTEA